MLRRTFYLIPKNHKFMKNLKHFYTLLMSIFFIFHINAQNFQFQGSITLDTTWQADTLEITGDVIIDSNITLTINPGTFVHITGYYAIWSYGKINAIGTAIDTIVFTHLDTLSHNDTSTIEGGWHGIRFLPRSSQDTSVFKYCKISNGKSVVPGSWPYEVPENQGGNIYGTDFGNMILSNCVISNGRVKTAGGGIYLDNGNYVYIEQCDFSFNHAHEPYGGGALLRRIQHVVVRESLFYRNTCFSQDPIGIWGHGSGLAVIEYDSYGAYALVENNRFFNNKSFTGTLHESYSNVIITGNIICNNYGSGINNNHFSNDAVYINNTVMNNVGSAWSGILTMSDGIELINNIVRNNYAYPNYPIEQIFFYNGAVPPPVVSYCNVEFGFEGEGNIDEKPLFVNPTLGIGIGYNALNADWTLLDDSQSINAGTPDTTGLNLPLYDLDGNPRVFGNRIDMGAYENQHVYVKIDEGPVSEEIKLYPNPGTNSLYLQIIPEMMDCFFDLYNSQGRIIMHHQIKDVNSIFTTDKLPVGVYHYRIYNQNRILKSSSWVKL